MKEFIKIQGVIVKLNQINYIVKDENKRFHINFLNGSNTTITFDNQNECLLTFNLISKYLIE